MATGSSSGPNFLHYGGSISPKTGKLGHKPAHRGSQFAARRRMENIARLENAGFTKTQIAAMLTISTNRLSHIMRSADYLTIRIAVTHGIVVDHDAQLSIIRAQRKEMLTQLLPPALQVLANELQAPATTLLERKHKAEIARDIMDREGTFAKVSKTEIKLDDKFNFDNADATSNSIISAIRGVAPPAPGHSKEAVEANKEFSNSHTLDSISQQEALNELERAASDPSALELLPTQGEPN